jgi:hypothetical protein
MDGLAADSACCLKASIEDVEALFGTGENAELHVKVGTSLV